MNALQLWQHGAIVLAAFVAGLMNSVAGGGTLVSFPALVWIGLDAKAANVTSTIALWPGSLAGFWGHRRDLAGARTFALRLVPPSLVGGLGGALLLLATPARVFEDLVPWLILGATVLFALREPIVRRIGRGGVGERAAGWWAAAIVFQFFVALYGGYFGAGIGILMLAALGLLGLTNIHQMNGLKNFLALSINGVALVCFVLSGKVVWSAALTMAVAAIAGALTGAALAHRVGRRIVSWVVVAIGVLVGISFFVKS